MGDRCSPMSSCAHLLCSVTDCGLYSYIRRTLTSGAAPFLLTAAVYVLIPAGGDMGEAAVLGESFGCGFQMHWTLLLPAAVIIVLCLLRVNIYITMAGSLLTAFVLGLLLQQWTPAELCTAALLGFTPRAEQSQMLQGGGALSMLRVVGIIGLSSTYLGIFRITKLKAWLERPFDMLSRRMGNRPAALLLSFPVAMFGCSQSMSTLLMGELCRHGAPNEQEAAMLVADSVMLTAILIPWNTLNAALCGAMGVESRTAFFAAYVFILPLVNTLWHTIKKKAPVSV